MKKEIDRLVEVVEAAMNDGWWCEVDHSPAFALFDGAHHAITEALKDYKAAKRKTGKIIDRSDQYKVVHLGEVWETISDGLVVILKDRSSKVDVGRQENPGVFAGTVDKRHLTTQFHVNMRAQGMRLRTGGT